MTTVTLGGKVFELLDYFVNPMVQFDNESDFGLFMRKQSLAMQHLRENKAVGDEKAAASDLREMLVREKARTNSLVLFSYMAFAVLAIAFLAWVITTCDDFALQVVICFSVTVPAITWVVWNCVCRVFAEINLFKLNKSCGE